MVDFAGWEMPVQYTSIVDEHLAVRTAAGLFDISHMGRLQFRGPSCSEFLNGVLTNDTSLLKPGDVRYSLICNPAGGILDDVLVYRLPDRWELVVNASNREKIVAWLQQSDGFSAVDFTDVTMATGMVAVQGPNALRLVNDLTGLDLSAAKYYSVIAAEYCGIAGLISRTGYTGEDGFELVMPCGSAIDIWQRLLAAGQSSGVVAAGLGCRDTLRMEAAMPLYGHELSESTDPLSAGLGFAVKFGKARFTGREALLAIRSEGLKQVRTGLVLEGRRIAREESPVLVNGQVAGRVTSGTFSPTLQKVIAMACLPVSEAVPGNRVEVNIRGSVVPAVVVSLPFYHRRA